MKVKTVKTFLGTNKYHQDISRGAKVHLHTIPLALTAAHSCTFTIFTHFIADLVLVLRIKHSKQNTCNQKKLEYEFSGRVYYPFLKWTTLFHYCSILSLAFDLRLGLFKVLYLLLYERWFENLVQYCFRLQITPN